MDSTPSLLTAGLAIFSALLYLLAVWRQVLNLETGEDKWIAFPIDRDGQDGGYYADLLPRYSFMPGDKALLISVRGKLARLDIATGALTDIPFTTPVKLGLGPLTRVRQKEETGPVRVRVVQAPRQSPDGRRVAFTALGGLYVQDLAAGAAPRIHARIASDPHAPLTHTGLLTSQSSEHRGTPGTVT